MKSDRRACKGASRDDKQHMRAAKGAREGGDSTVFRHKRGSYTSHAVWQEDGMLHKNCITFGEMVPNGG